MVTRAKEFWQGLKALSIPNLGLKALSMVTLVKELESKNGAGQRTRVTEPARMVT